MPQQERRTDATVPFSLDNPISFASLRPNSSVAESTITPRMRSAVQRVAGSVDETAWRLMFSPEEYGLTTAGSKARSLYAGRILSLGTTLVRPIVERGTAIDPGRFGNLLDDVAARVVGDHVKARLDYLDKQALARPPHSDITALVTSHIPDAATLGHLRKKGLGPEAGILVYGDALRELANAGHSGVTTKQSGEIDTGEYSALSDQWTRISNGVDLLERSELFSGLATTLDKVTVALRVPNGEDRKRKLKKVDLGPLRFYIAPTFS